MHIQYHGPSNSPHRGDFQLLLACWTLVGSTVYWGTASPHPWGVGEGAGLLTCCLWAKLFIHPLVPHRFCNFIVCHNLKETGKIVCRYQFLVVDDSNIFGISLYIYTALRLLPNFSSLLSWALCTNFKNGFFEKWLLFISVTVRINPDPWMRQQKADKLVSPKCSRGSIFLSLFSFLLIQLQ